MNRYSSTLFLTLLALPAVALAQERADAAPAEFVFQFQPPDGTKVKLAYRLEKNRVIDGQTPVRDVAESQTEGVFKRSGDGFEYAPKTVASAMSRNGSPVNDPIAALLSKVQVTYVISAGGEATSIRGFGEMDALIKATVSPQVAAVLAPVLNESAMVAREKAEWNARYSDFADGRFKIGDAIDVEAPQALPNGETITYTIRTTFPRWEACPPGQCVRIEQIYESDAAALARLAGGVMERLSTASSAPPGLVVASGKGARVSGSLTRLIDPRTMLIYSEQVRRVISMILALPGKVAVPTSQEEIRTYTYSYE